METRHPKHETLHYDDVASQLVLLDRIEFKTVAGGQPGVAAAAAAACSPPSRGGRW